jgi:hypothetical protein
LGGAEVAAELRAVSLAKGVAAADAGLGALVAAPLVAVTVAVTGVPSARPLMTHEVAPFVATQVWLASTEAV